MKSAFESFSEELDKARSLITTSVKESTSNDIELGRRVYSDLIEYYRQCKDVIVSILDNNGKVVIPTGFVNILLFRDKVWCLQQLINSDNKYKCAFTNHNDINNVVILISLDMCYATNVSYKEVFYKSNSELIEYLFKSSFLRNVIIHEVQHVKTFRSLGDYKNEYLQNQLDRYGEFNMLEFEAYRKQAIDNLLNKINKEDLKTLSLDGFIQKLFEVNDGEFSIEVLKNHLDEKILRIMLKRDFEDLKKNNFLIKESHKQHCPLTKDDIRKILDMLGLTLEDVMKNHKIPEALTNLNEPNKEVESFKNKSLEIMRNIMKQSGNYEVYKDAGLIKEDK